MARHQGVASAVVRRLLANILYDCCGAQVAEKTYCARQIRNGLLLGNMMVWVVIIAALALLI